MNTFLSSEQEALLERYRDYVKENIAPLAPALDERSHSQREVLQSLGQAGYLSITVAREYNGQGAPFLNLCLFAQAVAEADPGLAFSLAAHQAVIELISSAGTDKQKSRYLPLLARGECIGALALTEETAGSDYAAMQTVVHPEGDKYVLAGKKTWVVNGDIANLAAVVARRVGDIGDEAAAGRLSIWLVDVEEKGGIKVSDNRKKLGLRSASTNDLEFIDAPLAKDAYLGEVDPKEMSDDSKFDNILLHAMDVSKVVVAASAIGLLAHALNESVQHARTREQFGANIGKLQAIQWKLADMSAESAAAKMLTYRAAWSKEGDPATFRKNAAMCKYYAARTARVHSSEAVQICGALGVSDEAPLEKIYRDAKVMEICEGTSEIQKNIIARELGATV